jgi:integrase/recombinase XerD
VAVQFRAERAVSPVDGSVSFVVVDECYEIHPEASAYLAWLRYLDRSSNTERVYAGRIALFLSYCSDMRLDWRAMSVGDLSRFLRSLVQNPIHRRGHGSDSVKLRSSKTANAILTAVCEFLRFGATRGWVKVELADSLRYRKFLHYTPPGFDSGEEQQFRSIRARSLKLAELDDAPEWLTADQISSVLETVSRLRDRLLVAVLAETGVRIGEALGLRREDMHLLSSSSTLGCQVAGPHVHVRRRVNANGALAKCRFARTIPVTEGLVDFYAEYQGERTSVDRDGDCDFAFVNLYRPPVGAPLRYYNVKKMFDRASADLGFVVRPHMFRHSAATRWLSAGVPRDVVQALLGHVSPASMEVYFHPTDAQKRAAVEHAALVVGELD